jgi:phosphatidylglycerophosphatase A
MKLHNVHTYIVTLLGTGNLPIAPGTWGSFVVALPALAVVINLLPGQHIAWWYAIATVVFCVLGLVSIPRVQAEWGTDPSAVVIDEAAGMALICATPYMYVTEWHWLAGFLVFRLLDIKKPWPCSWFNDRHEAWGVMGDDMMAAVYTVIVLHVGMLSTTILASMFAMI